jgi:hypothetical protein
MSNSPLIERSIHIGRSCIDMVQREGQMQRQAEQQRMYKIEYEKLN